VTRTTKRVTAVAIVVIKYGVSWSKTPSSVPYARKGMALRKMLEKGKKTEMPASIPQRFFKKARNSFSSSR
jgi:hypothetical protein